MYFVQLLPSIGHFINSIQRMLVIMAQFTLIYFMVLFPFPHGFQRLMQDQYGCNAKHFDEFFMMIYR